MEERSMHRDQCGRSKVTKGTMELRPQRGGLEAECAGPCQPIQVLAFTLTDTEGYNLT